MTHPLTDEIMRKIHGNRPGYSNPFDEDDMRAAYDLGWKNAKRQDEAYIREAYRQGLEDAQDIATCIHRKDSLAKPVTLEELES